MKIAIVWGDYSHSEYDDSRWISSGITEWTEVTEEEYKLLCRYKHKLNGPAPYAAIIVQNSTGEVRDSIAACLEFAKKEEASAEARKLKAAQAKVLKAAQDRTKREQLYQELKSEFES